VPLCLLQYSFWSSVSGTSPSVQHRSTRPHLSILLPQKHFQTATSATHAVPPQTACVQLSENANADVEKGRPSRSRGQDCPLTQCIRRSAGWGSGSAASG